MPQQTFTPGQILTAAECMLIPQGLIGSASVTSTQATSSTSSPGTALTGLSVTVTVPASRTLKLSFVVPFTSAGGGQVTVVLQEGGTILGAWSDYASAAIFQCATGFELVTPSAGSHTYYISAYNAAGDFMTQCASINPGRLLVEDV